MVNCRRLGLACSCCEVNKSWEGLDPGEDCWMGKHYQGADLITTENHATGSQKFK